MSRVTDVEVSAFSEWFFFFKLNFFFFNCTVQVFRRKRADGLHGRRGALRAQSEERLNDEVNSIMTYANLNTYGHEGGEQNNHLNSFFFIQYRSKSMHSYYHNWIFEIRNYTSTKSWRSYIFTPVFLWTKFQPNGCTNLDTVFTTFFLTTLAQSLLKLVTLGQSSRSQ